MAKARTKANGEGTIYPYIKNNKTYYRGMLTIGRDESGKLIRKSFSGSKKKDVVNKMAEYKTKHNNGLLPTDDKITLEQWFYTWLFDFRINNLKPSSLERYEGIYRNYIQGSPIGKKPLNNIRPTDIQGYYNALIATNKTPSIIKTLNKVLKASLSEAAKQDYIIKNPCEAITLPKENKKEDIIVFTKEEQTQLISSLNGHKLKMLIVMALGTGLRVGELLALKWHDIDFINNTVSINKSIKLVYIVDKAGNRKGCILEQTPKTKSSIRNVPIPLNIIEQLKRYRQDQEEKLKNEVYENHNIIFTDDTGNYIDTRYLTKRYTKLLNEAGIPYKKFHSLRHTYATRLFEAGIPIKTVQVLMGHSDIKTTMNIYTHVMPEEKTKAVDKINSLFEF